MDEDTKARMRRYNRNIEISGLVVIVYGFWTVIKFLIPVIIGTSKVFQLLEMDPQEYEEDKWIIFLILVGLFGVMILSHYFLGRMAISYARGKRNKIGFLILAVIILVSTVTFLPEYLTEIQTLKTFEDWDNIIAEFMVDMTLIFVLCDMVISTFRVRKLRKLEGCLS